MRERQNDEREASIQIQRVFRGAKGRWHARKQEVVRSSRTAAAHVLTRHVRYPRQPSLVVREAIVARGRGKRCKLSTFYPRPSRRTNQILRTEEALR